VAPACPLHPPPLRERRSDIPDYYEIFLQKNKENNGMMEDE